MDWQKKKISGSEEDLEYGIKEVFEMSSERLHVLMILKHLKSS